MSVAATVARSARPNFLILTPVCIFPALAAAHADGYSLAPLTAALIVVAGVLAHAAVNLINEWDDFRSGLDMTTQRTPFSGGSGALPAVPAASSAVLAAGLTGLTASALIGVYLMAQSGPGLLLPGVVGIALVVAYTAWITRRPLLCLLAPGLGFGPIMVAGSYYAVTGHYSAAILWASLTPMLLVSGLLLINQFPDVEPDRLHGRRHLPILLGQEASARLFVVVLMLAYLVPVTGVLAGVLPMPMLLILLAAPAAFMVGRKALLHADDPKALTPWLGLNVATLMATIVLMGVGFLLG
ncbi:prenyltransferase [Wenzhouxiangella limi]|uniref:Prenyltransferase n=1 Tax=Wenzhouxiangella limi TaxID=2707351 RepID=A0A845UV48_9GAMM|nr:prenyltransferase [Wenzhouxiangella limi]NDY95713.1 prenyltransferase [Wenzhouxiangella limi]